MIVTMAGLPASGKSTLARRLASDWNGLVVDKDSVRAVLFGAFVDYTQEQDDLSMECVYSAVQYMARARPSAPVFVDGRAFALRYQWERALEVMRATGAAWRVIETECSDEAARERLAAANTNHPAANRDFELYLSLKARREPITAPKLIVNTEHPLEECLHACREYIISSATSPTG